MSNLPTSRLACLDVIRELTELLDSQSADRAAELRALSGQPDIAIDIALHEEHVTFFHSNTPGKAHVLQMEYAFGKLPSARADEALIRLLQLNFEVSSERHALFAIDDRTGEVVYTYPCAIGVTTPEALLSLIVAVRRLAHEWRRHYFLDMEEDVLYANPILSHAGLLEA